MPVDFGVRVFGGAGASSPLSLLTATSAKPSPPHTSPLLFGPPLLCGASCFPHPKPPSPAELPLHHPLPVFSGARQQWGNTLGGGPRFPGIPSPGVPSPGVLPLGILSLGVLSLGILPLGVLSLGVLSLGVPSPGVPSLGVLSPGIPSPLRVRTPLSVPSSLGVPSSPGGPLLSGGSPLLREIPSPLGGVPSPLWAPLSLSPLRGRVASPPSIPPSLPLSIHPGPPRRCRPGRDLLRSGGEGGEAARAEGGREGFVSAPPFASPASSAAAARSLALALPLPSPRRGAEGRLQRVWCTHTAPSRKMDPLGRQAGGSRARCALPGRQRL